MVERDQDVHVRRASDGVSSQAEPPGLLHCRRPAREALLQYHKASESFWLAGGNSSRRSDAAAERLWMLGFLAATALVNRCPLGGMWAACAPHGGNEHVALLSSCRRAAGGRSAV